MITIDDFIKLELRIGRVQSAESVESSSKLVKLKINFGSELGQRTVLSGIKKQYVPEALVGRQVVVLTNLEPKEIAGIESEGMVLSAESEAGPVLLVPLTEASLGAKVR